MEINKLRPFVLLIVLVGMLLGAGILSLDKFGVATKDSVTISDEVITISSGTGSLANDDVTALTIFENSSSVFINNNESTSNLVNYTTAGVVTTSLTDDDYNVTYTYDADSESTTSTTNVISELNNISSNWLGLIVTITILAIIITLIIRSFGQGLR